MSKGFCKYCNIEFFIQPRSLKVGQGKYCSRQCHYLDIRMGKIINCFVCDKEVYKNPAQLEHSKSRKYFCSKSCQARWRNIQYSGSKHKNWKDGKQAYKSVLSRHHISAICKLCGDEDRRILAIHHLDQDRTNNNVTNLTWLCHNCHYLVHHDKVEKQKLMVAMV